MEAPRLSEEDRGRVARRAARELEALAAAALGEPARAELVDQRIGWTQMRWQAEHHFHLLMPVTGLGLILDGTDPQRLLGWQIDKRAAGGDGARLPEEALIARARALPQIGAERPLLRQAPQPLEGGRQCTVLGFGGDDPADRRDVWINPGTGEVIGVFPPRNGDLGPVAVVGTPGAPLPAEVQAALAAAQVHAWALLEASLAGKLDAEALAQARQILRFMPTRGGRDASGRWTLRYELWRQHSVSDIALDLRNGEVLSWYIEAAQADAPERRLTAEAALAAARPQLGPREGASGPRISFDAVGEDEKATVHWWHTEAGFNIEGDHTTVLLNADSGRAFSVARKWRRIDPALLAPPRIPEAQALALADKAHGGGQPGKLLGRSIIELIDDTVQPVAAYDLPVWRVGYPEQGGIGFTELAIDCHHGKVVRRTGW